MFSERHAVSLLKREDLNGKSKLKIQKFLEDISKADQDHVKIDVHEVPSDIRKDAILWMMTEAHNLRLSRSCFYNALDRYDLRCSEEISDGLGLHKLFGLFALRIESTINGFFAAVNQGELSEEASDEMEESLLEKVQTADSYLDGLVHLLEDSTASTEQNKAVLEMREVLDLCILDKRFRTYSPLALAAGVYFWYARGAQAPWLHFVSSMCPDMIKVVDWVVPIIKIVNGRHLEAQIRVS